MSDPFERLDPPSGGLVRLRARLDAESGRRNATWQFALAAGVLLVAVTGVMVSPFGPYRVTLFDTTPLDDAPPARASFDLGAHPGAVTLGMQAPSEQVVSVLPGSGEHFAVQAVSSDADVVVVMVASVDTDTPRFNADPIER